MAYPEKWRETCDPFALAYHEFRPTEVLGYPHAGNDVFCMRAEWEGREVTAYVKVARQESANLANEVNILSQLDAPIFPRRQRRITKVLSQRRKRGNQDHRHRFCVYV